MGGVGALDSVSSIAPSLTLPRFAGEGEGWGGGKTDGKSAEPHSIPSARSLIAADRNKSSITSAAAANPDRDRAVRRTNHW